jgi:hypothetical protein
MLNFEYALTGTCKPMLAGCELNYLTGFDVQFLLRRVVCVTGVSRQYGWRANQPD